MQCFSPLQRRAASLPRRGPPVSGHPALLNHLGDASGGSRAEAGERDPDAVKDASESIERPAALIFKDRVRARSLSGGSGSGTTLQLGVPIGTMVVGTVFALYIWSATCKEVSELDFGDFEALFCEEESGSGDDAGDSASGDGGR